MFIVKSTSGAFYRQIYVLTVTLSKKGKGLQMKKFFAGFIALCLVLNALFFTAFASENFGVSYNDYDNSFSIEVNRFSYPTDINILTAIYKNNILDKVFIDKHIADEGNTYITNTFNPDLSHDLSDYSFKFFFWDDNLTPVQTAYTFPDYEGGFVTEYNVDEGVLTLISESGERLIYKLADGFKLYIDGLEETDYNLDYYINYLSSVGCFVNYTVQNEEITNIFGTSSIAHIGYEAKYHADTRSFRDKAIDKSSVVLMLAFDENGDIDYENIRTGDISLLKDGMFYSYAAYTDKWSANGNRIVVTSEAVRPSSETIAVVTSAEEAQNTAGENIYSLSYYQARELYENIPTTPEVYQSITGLTKGDILKIKYAEDGTVTAIERLIDFDMPVRDKETGLMSFSEPINHLNEDIGWAYGYVEKYNYSSGSSVFINGTDPYLNFRLTTTTNVYVIDCMLRDCEVFVGSYRDVEFDRDMEGNPEIIAPYIFAIKNNDPFIVNDAVIILGEANLY